MESLLWVYCPVGQVAGVIDDLPPCMELINTIVAEAQQRLSQLALRVQKEELTMSKPFNTRITTALPR